MSPKKQKPKLTNEEKKVMDRAIKYNFSNFSYLIVPSVKTINAKKDQIIEYLKQQPNNTNDELVLKFNEELKRFNNQKKQKFQRQKDKKNHNLFLMSNLIKCY